MPPRLLDERALAPPPPLKAPEDRELEDRELDPDDRDDEPPISREELSRLPPPMSRVLALLPPMSRLPPPAARETTPISRVDAPPASRELTLLPAMSR